MVNKKSVNPANPVKSYRKRRQSRKRRNTTPLVPAGHRFDYFDTRVMQVIKHRLAISTEGFEISAHDCTFRAEVGKKFTLFQK